MIRVITVCLLMVTGVRLDRQLQSAGVERSSREETSSTQTYRSGRDVCIHRYRPVRVLHRADDYHGDPSDPVLRRLLYGRDTLVRQVGDDNFTLSVI